MKTRFAAVSATLLAAVVVPVLAAAPALAYGVDDGEPHHTKMGVGEAILIYVGIPVGIFLVIAFFSVLPSMLRRPRYRPGRPWNFDPLWFAGPDEPEKAVAAARPGVTARGGASAEW